MYTKVLVGFISLTIIEIPMVLNPVIIDNSKKIKTYPLYIKALLSGDYRGSATISLVVRVKGMMEEIMVYELANDTITFTDNSSKLSVGHIEPVITERYIKEF